MSALLSVCLGRVPSLPLMSCLALGKSLSLSEPLFSSLFQSAHDNNDIPFLGNCEDSRRKG